MTKYHAKQITIQGIRFDSKAEGQYYLFLLSQKQLGRIKEIELQPKFEIIPGYTRLDGKKVRPTHYIADFKVTYTDGRVELVDVKGIRTPSYVLKKKLFEFRYPNYMIKEVVA